MINLKMKKYITLFTMIIILLAAPLTTPMAFADDKEDKKDKDNKESTTIIATVYGKVIDLGLQKYDIKGKDGPIYWLFFDIAEPKTSFELKANVEDGIVDGKMKIKVKGNNDEGKVELKIDIPVNMGFSVPLLTVDEDFIPMVFAGTGEAELKIGKNKILSSLTVIVDTTTAQHPFNGEGNTGQVNVWGCDTTAISTYFDCLENPFAGAVFFLSVDIDKFKVKYTGVLMEGTIFIDGEFVGTMTQIADADEDHVKNTEKDKGKITLNFLSGDLIGETSGKYNGKSEQNPDYFHLYDGTGKFDTKGDFKLKGTYDTTWPLPLSFISTFTGTVK